MEVEIKWFVVNHVKPKACRWVPLRSFTRHLKYISSGRKSRRHLFFLFYFSYKIIYQKTKLDPMVSEIYIN